MKNIIVPVDFSQNSIDALSVAIDLANKNSGKITILHCIEMPGGYLNRGGANELPEALFFIKIAEKKMNEVCQQVTSCGVDVIPVIEILPILDSIEKITKEGNYDLVVMGSKGASGMKETIIGSTAQKVIQSANTSVLVIKDKTDIKKLDKIVFACNMSFKYQGAVRKAADFANFTNTSLHLLYVNTPYAFKTTREINDRIKKFKEEVRDLTLDVHVYDDFSIENGVTNFADDNKIDILCMNPTKKHPFYSLFSTTSQDIVNHSDRPILVIRS